MVFNPNYLFFNIYLHYISAKFGIYSNMANDNNSINSNWNVGTSANGGNENVLEEQSEQQPPAKKSRMDDPISQEDPAEIAIQNEGPHKEIAELKLKNQKLTEENKAFEAKLKKLEEMVQMNEQKIDQTKHEMKVQLPKENWFDLLEFVPRIQLGNIVAEIGDYYFSDIIQSFLHDPVKEITLGNIRIIAPRPYVTTDLPMVRVWPNAATNIPDWPMPGNIKDFKEIDLNYVDTSVLHFLEKFQENSLLSDVNMYIDWNFEILNRRDIPQALIKISPFITSIDSMTFPEIVLFEIVYNNNDGGNTTLELLKEMMDKARILSTDSSIHGRECHWNGRDWCCNWLYTPRDDGKPRMLKSNYHINGTDCASFVRSITANFEMEDYIPDPVSFFIYTKVEQSDYTIEDISLENDETDEKLVIKTYRDDDDDWSLLISRYPLDADKSWIEANEKEIIEWDPEKLNRNITMDSELTITK